MNNTCHKAFLWERKVPRYEADPSDGKISDESPVGVALIGHAIGDVVEVEVPAGVIGFKVLDIFK